LECGGRVRGDQGERRHRFGICLQAARSRGQNRLPTRISAWSACSAGKSSRWGEAERRNSKNVPKMFSFVQFSTTSDPGRVCAKLSRADVPRSGVSVERRSADFGPAGFRLARPPTAPWRARKNFVQKRARLQPLTLNNPVFTGFGTIGTVSKLSKPCRIMPNRARSCHRGRITGYRLLTLAVFLDATVMATSWSGRLKAEGRWNDEWRMTNCRPRLLTPTLSSIEEERDAWRFRAPARGQISRRSALSNTLSCFGALGLKVHDRMAGLFLAFASFGKQPVNAVSARRGQLVLGAPDFPQDKVAFAPVNGLGLQCFHQSFMNSSGVASEGSV